MRDKNVCENCNRSRSQHYNDDGSWNDKANEKAKCAEYVGRYPSPEESAKLAKGVEL